MALRSKSYNKDWERIARPEPNKNFNVTEDVLAKGLAQIDIKFKVVIIRDTIVKLEHKFLFICNKFEFMDNHCNFSKRLLS